MLFQKILDSVSSNADLDYSYKELQNDFIGLLIPTQDKEPEDDKILGASYDFLTKHKVTKVKYFTPWYDNFKQRGVKIIVTRMKPYLKAYDRLFYYFLLPNTIHTNELAFFCSEAEKYFLEKGIIKFKNSLSTWFNPTYKIPGKDFLSFEMIKDFDPVSKYKLKSDKAKDLFRDILSESLIDKKVYSKEELEEFDKHSLYTNRKDANFVFDFLKQNPNFAIDYKIVVRKKKTMPSGFTLVPDDMFFILARKKPSNRLLSRIIFCYNLDKEFLSKKGVPFFYDYRYVKFEKASSITNLGKIEDYDPLDKYEAKQKTKDLFGDILLDSLSKTNRDIIPKEELANSTSAFISTERKTKYPNWFYEFINEVDVSRYNLDFKYFKDVGVKVGLYPDTGFLSIIIPNSVYDDEVARSVFNIELDMFLKRKGVEDMERELVVKNLYMPTDSKETVLNYHPLMEYDMKSDKAKETFKDII